MTDKKDRIKYEIISHIGVISEGSKGWAKELNLISWNDAAPKYDIRDWNSDHSKMGKGITLTEQELRKLKAIIDVKVAFLDEEDLTFCGNDEHHQKECIYTDEFIEQLFDCYNLYVFEYGSESTLFFNEQDILRKLWSKIAPAYIQRYWDSEFMDFLACILLAFLRQIQIKWRLYKGIILEDWQENKWNLERFQENLSWINSWGGYRVLIDRLADKYCLGYGSCYSQFIDNEKKRFIEKNRIKSEEDWEEFLEEDETPAYLIDKFELFLKTKLNEEEIIKKFMDEMKRVIKITCDKEEIKEVFFGAGKYNLAVFNTYWDMEKFVQISFGELTEAKHVYSNGQIKINWVEIPEGITKIGVAVFSNNANIEMIRMPSTLKKIGVSAFKNCEKLSQITIPLGVTEIGADAFSGCSKLRKIEIPDGVEEIKDCTFQYCGKLESIQLSRRIKNIGCYAFEYSMNLTNIVFPDCIKMIGEKAFAGCTNLREVSLPKSIEYIAEDAFEGCPNVEIIYRD